MKVNNLQITHRFKFFDSIVLDANKQLWQLAHFSRASKRTRSMRKLTYNKDRDAYRINDSWVKCKELQNLCYPCREIVNQKFSKNAISERIQLNSWDKNHRELSDAFMQNYEGIS